MSEAATETRRQTKEEWHAEGVERFGEDEMNWRFVCPACGHVQTPADFKPYKDQGAQPGFAYTRCMGRVDRSVVDCDWASFGLFGTLGKGRFVVLDDGSELDIFDFAPSHHLHIEEAAT